MDVEGSVAIVKVMWPLIGPILDTESGQLAPLPTRPFPTRPLFETTRPHSNKIFPTRPLVKCDRLTKNI